MIDHAAAGVDGDPGRVGSEFGGPDDQALSRPAVVPRAENIVVVRG